MLKLCIRTRDRVRTLTLPEAPTLQTLCNLIFSITDIHPANQELRTVFPPRRITLDYGPYSRLEDLGIAHNDTIYVEPRVQLPLPRKAQPSSSTSASTEYTRSIVHRDTPTSESTLPSSETGKGAFTGRNRPPSSSTSSSSSLPSLDIPGSMPKSQPTKRQLPQNASNSCLKRRKTHSSVVEGSSYAVVKKMAERSVASSDRDCSSGISSCAPSNASSGSFLSSVSKPGSILDVIREHTSRALLGKAGEDENSSGPKLEPKKDRPKSSTIAWKHRQNRRILEKPRKRARKVDNAVEDLFASEMMDVIEWSAAEARRARITEDPLLTTLDDIEAELVEQKYLTEMMPEKYAECLVNMEDITEV